jgi:acyl carrier protein
MKINQNVLNHGLSVQSMNIALFYECAEFQMISLFEELYGTKVDRVQLKTLNDDKALIDSIKSMVLMLSKELKFNINTAQMEALTVNLFAHSVVPVGVDNIVMRDYFNPVLMNHFNLYCYLSEYINTYKDVIFFSNKQELNHHLQQIGYALGILSVNPINQGCIPYIVDRLVRDQGDVIDYTRIEPKDGTKREFIKFKEMDCQKDFTEDNGYLAKDYQLLIMSKINKSGEWIKRELERNCNPKEITQEDVRFYMYHFLETEYFNLSYKYRSGLPRFIRHAVHSTISELTSYVQGSLRIRVPSEVFGVMKSQDFLAWIDYRYENEKWLSGYRNPNSVLFKDIVAKKVLEMSYMRDSAWDNKLKSKRIKEAISHLSGENKKRSKLRNETLSNIYRLI